MAYNNMLIKSFHGIQEILKKNIEFEGEGSIYDNLDENGGVFKTKFKWKTVEGGSLSFPPELK
jgi:hypothetical protein